MPSSSTIRTFKVSKPHHQTEISKFVAQMMEISVRKSKALLDERKVWVNNQRVWMAKHRLSTGDVVEVQAPTSSSNQSSPSPVKVLYEDSYLVAIQKPAGMVCESHKHSLETHLRDQRDDPQFRALHRLDKNTSGVVLFTKGDVPRGPYIERFRMQEVTKTYAALLAGTLPKSPIKVTQRLDGKQAESVFQVIRQKKGFSRVSCEILTGRTHQIRRHALHMDCRVLGDTKYKGGPALSDVEKAIPRQMLHAERIQLICPHTGAHLDIQAPWPDDFSQTASKLGIS